MFKVSARTILELGSELISSDIIALYELAKNGFDAKTMNGVEIRFDVILRRNAYLTLARVAEKPSATLQDLREITQREFNADSPKALLDRAAAILQNVQSVPDFKSALNEIYLLNSI